VDYRVWEKEIEMKEKSLTEEIMEERTYYRRRRGRMGLSDNYIITDINDVITIRDRNFELVIELGEESMPGFQAFRKVKGGKLNGERLTIKEAENIWHYRYSDAPYADSRSEEAAINGIKWRHDKNEKEKRIRKIIGK
jgi:hypothetical protein